MRMDEYDEEYKAFPKQSPVFHTGKPEEKGRIAGARDPTAETQADEMATLVYLG